ncbi:MAG: hypothetical protein H5T61_12760 [Thermoflexales bacterium]|nr:hypothetical protein [Thermoflexales bacterium]
MRRLSIGRQVVEVGERYFLSLISHLAKGYYALAEAYHNCHVSGFADWKGTFQMPDIGQSEVINALEAQIDDDELHEAFNSLREQLRELKEVDRQIVKWLAELVGLPSLWDEQDRACLEQRLHKIVAEGPDGRPQGPVWVMHPEYQALVERSREVMAAVSETQRRIEQRLQQLLECSAEV